jgi:hypothetical protein
MRAYATQSLVLPLPRLSVVCAHMPLNHVCFPCLVAPPYARIRHRITRSSFASLGVSYARCPYATKSLKLRAYTRPPNHSCFPCLVGPSYARIRHPGRITHYSVVSNVACATESLVPSLPRRCVVCANPTWSFHAWLGGQQKTVSASEVGNQLSEVGNGLSVVGNGLSELSR